MRPVSFFVCSSYDKEKKVSVLYIVMYGQTVRGKTSLLVRVWAVREAERGDWESPAPISITLHSMSPSPVSSPKSRAAACAGCCQLVVHIKHRCFARLCLERATPHPGRMRCAMCLSKKLIGTINKTKVSVPSVASASFGKKTQYRYCVDLPCSNTYHSRTVSKYCVNLPRYARKGDGRTVHYYKHHIVKVYSTGNCDGRTPLHTSRVVH
jgi:hypothetical protein